MARDDAGGSGVVLVAFMLGAITGAAVALLYAPASGSDTRRFLGDRAKEGKDLAYDAASKGREFVNRQKETLTNAIERGKEAYERARGGQEEGA